MPKFTDLQQAPPFSHTGSNLNDGFKFISTTIDDLAYTPSAEDTAQFVATGRKCWKTLKNGKEAVWPPSL